MTSLSANRFERCILPLLTIFVVATCACDAYGRAPEAGPSESRKADSRQLNVLLICVDDLRPELNCFGRSYIHSPNIDRLASTGRAFTRHYVQAPTCGASRFALLTGRYGGAGNGALFERAKQLAKNPDLPASMPAWFRQNGYTTVSVGKVSHHPGGRGGPDWNDDSQPEMPNSWDRHLLPAGDWQHPRGWMHGLAHGEIRRNAKDMAVYQAAEGDDSIYPDGVSIPVALAEMETLARGEKPFFLACGILRPHLPFGAPKRYLDLYSDVTLPEVPHPAKPSGKTTWHGSGEFMKYQRWGRNPNTDEEFSVLVRKHYAACVSYADAQVGRLLDRLEELEIADRTIVVLWGDHGWHLGEHAIWGKHSLFEESLLSPLIVRYPGITAAGATSPAIVETIDIFPTLCELSGLPAPLAAHGQSLMPQLSSADSSGRVAIAYHRNAKTIRTPTHRLVSHKDGHLELYDHQSVKGETLNIADAQPEMAIKLLKQLDARLSLR